MKIIGEFQTTVMKALDEIDPRWKSYPGLIVCGTHKPDGIDHALEEIQKIREHGLPYIGICFGHQLAAIEYARNVLGIYGASSEEFFDGECPYPAVVKKLPALHVGQFDGETYWNNYEVIEDVLKVWKKADNFITCQYHPEYQSSVDKPHPLLLKFIHHAKNHGKQ